MTFDSFFQPLLTRFPWLDPFLRDPGSTATITSPTSGQCYPGFKNGVAADVSIPWNVSTPFNPKFTADMNVFKFKTDGTLAAVTFTFDNTQSPPALVIAKGDIGLASATDCIDLMLVMYQIDKTTSKRSVTGVSQFTVCGNCPTTPTTTPSGPSLGGGKHPKPKKK